MERPSAAGGSFSVAAKQPLPENGNAVAATDARRRATKSSTKAAIPDDHAGMGHYGFMVACSFTVVGVGLLASLRPDGRWLPVWTAGLFPVLLSLASLVYPDPSSSFGPIWALAATAWGALFVAAAELTEDVKRPTLVGSLRGPRGTISMDNTGVRPTKDQPPATPRWATVASLIAIGVVLGWVTLPVIVIVGQMAGVWLWRWKYSRALAQPA